MYGRQAYECEQDILWYEEHEKEGYQDDGGYLLKGILVSIAATLLISLI